MNRDDRGKARQNTMRAPIFESMWLALFLLLRHEWMLLRPGNK